ncbi:hypothetical protein EZV62_006852 [Acer yangbiense]|uniref:Pentacotripeptide-repeat region of PRORP domain-containing protein n=1 Tax=Acer yangbiense TaxID=1000413 RepID=A0A5C7I8T2_9ROSI|nr:hypothetical protein EZV62_006852 [Acer yangbiense]
MRGSALQAGSTGPLDWRLNPSLVLVCAKPLEVGFAPPDSGCQMDLTRASCQLLVLCPLVGLHQSTQIATKFATLGSDLTAAFSFTSSFSLSAFSCIWVVKRVTYVSKSIGVDMRSGLKVFDEIPKWNVVAWTNLIAGYVNNDCATEAIRVFKDMESLNVEPNEITLVHVLVACARSRDLEALGVFSDMLVSGFDPDNSTFLSIALVDMYAKSGEAESARKVFSDLKRKDTMASTSMIIGLAMHGYGEEALSTFKRMQEDATVNFTRFGKQFQRKLTMHLFEVDRR